MATQLDRLRAAGYDLRIQDCTRTALKGAGLTIVRDLLLHLENGPAQAILRRCFESSPLVFTTTFVTGRTRHPFTNDAEERAQRFMTERRNLEHAMFDLSESPFSLRALGTYVAPEDYRGKVMRLYRREDQTAAYLNLAA